MDAEPSTGRFEALPEPIDPDSLITTKESSDAPDPEAGRNTDHDFLLRYGLS
jgi:hypothetical protein